MLTATQLVNSKGPTQTHSDLLCPFRILSTGSQKGDQQVIKFSPRVSLSEKGTHIYNHTIHTYIPHTHTYTPHTHTHTHGYNTHIHTHHTHI